MSSPTRPDHPGAAEPRESAFSRFLHDVTSDTGRMLRVIALAVTFVACFGLAAIVIDQLDWPIVLILALCVTVTIVAHFVTKARRARAGQQQFSGDSAVPAPRPREGDSGSEWSRFPPLH